MELLTRTFDKIMGYDISSLSVGDIAKDMSDKSIKKLPKLKVLKDKWFDKNSIKIEKHDSSLILSNVFTIKECERLLFLNCKKCENNSNGINQYLAESEKLASILIERIHKLVRYNLEFGSTSVSKDFIFSEFTNKSVYYHIPLNIHVYIFLNGGFKGGYIDVNHFKYKPKTGSVLITNKECIGNKIKDGNQYVIQGTLFRTGYLF